MGRVDRCNPEDVPAVADLHTKVFFGQETAASEGLRNYYRTLFFENPWYDDELPSLVYRTNGRVTGFLGLVPRRMQLRQQTVRLVITHRLMVAPDVGSPMAAFQLMREAMEAPQDLLIADGVNDKGRKVLEWSGATVSPIYSLKWLRPLRPAAFALNMLGKRRPSLGLIAGAARPFGAIADAVACRLPASPFALEAPDTEGRALDIETLLAGLDSFSRGHTLRPQYDRSSLNWLLDFLKDNHDRGDFQSVGIFDADDQLIGLALYYMHATNVAEIMLLASRDATRDAVLQHLMYHAWRIGAVGLIGRFEPKFLQAFSNQDCLMKAGDWAFLHARDPEIVHIINQGEAFISALEGELWMRSPMDRL